MNYHETFAYCLQLDITTSKTKVGAVPYIVLT